MGSVDTFSIIVFIIEVLVVAFIIYKQVKSYLANKERMDNYANIFSESDSWTINIDEENIPSISGGTSNPYFRQIVDSINDYITSNANSIMDSQVFKDKVDRMCDSLENEIESQTPIPLYFGLSGTMLGIIIGLFTLVPSLSKMIAGSNFGGITFLLLAVAVAMIASFIGIGETIFATNNYKDKRNIAEKGKSDFISWMQTELYPLLPNDISLAMTEMVDNLNGFNEDFKKNTNTLSDTFKDVNQSYATSEKILHDIESIKLKDIYLANISVLKQLQQSTEKIERFNDYLNSVDALTSKVKEYTELYQKRESEVGLLKEIRDFFQMELSEIQQRKKEIGTSVAQVDSYLKHNFTELGNDAADLSNDFKEQLVEQAKAYKGLLEEQKKAFEEAFRQIQQRLEEQLSQMPESMAQLKEIAKIPSELQDLSSSLKQSMGEMSAEFSRAIDRINIPQTVQNAPHVVQSSQQTPVVVRYPISKREKIIGAIILGLITLSSLTAAVFCALTYFVY